MAQLAPQFAWLEITGFCNLACRHCYAGSSPQGTHGTMTPADWQRVIDELAALGVRDVQFIGGEPTLHPDLPHFIHHARGRGMRVEVFSNLTHISRRRVGGPPPAGGAARLQLLLGRCAGP
ncbi:radical SAM protein [Streptomyces lydicus]